MSISKSIRITVITIIAICALSITNLFAQTQASTGETVIKNSADAIKSAVESKKYLFAVFYKDAVDEKYKKLESNVLKFKKSSTAEIMIYGANISDTKESEVVSKYRLDKGAPMPLAMVIAPNGAVLGGINSDTPESDYSKTIVSSLTMDILKTVQDQKIAMVMLQNKQTKFNEESKKAVKESMADPKIAGFANAIEADPDKSENQDFLKQCKIEGKVTEAVVVIVIPPVAIAGVLKGNITKENIMSSLVSGCGSGGCGSGGCK